MLHIQHVLSVISLGRCHYPFCFNAYIHGTASTDFTGEKYLSARHWTRGRGARGARPGLPFSEGKQSEKSNVADEGTREGQSSQSLGHSQYGSLWCNHDAEAPCFGEPSVEAFSTLQRTSFVSSLLFPTLSQAVGQSLAPYSLSNLPT